MIARSERPLLRNAREMYSNGQVGVRKSLMDTCLVRDGVGRDEAEQWCNATDDGKLAREARLVGLMTNRPRGISSSLSNTAGLSAATLRGSDLYRWFLSVFADFPAGQES
jgi:hypothetical protein